MPKDFLERPYWACSDQSDLWGEGLNLGEMYERSDDTEESGRRFVEALGGSGVDAKQNNALDELAMAMACVHEKQGFVNGFRLGMKLAGEIGAVTEWRAVKSDE